jgi:hypothetical protein
LRKANHQQSIIILSTPVDNTHYEDEDKEKFIEHPIPSNACFSLEGEEATSRNTPVQLQKRPFRFFTQKDLEQKEKYHVQMRTERCATSTVMSKFYLPKKENFPQMNKNREQEGRAQDVSKKNESFPREIHGQTYCAFVCHL